MPTLIPFFKVICSKLLGLLILFLTPLLPLIFVTGLAIGFDTFVGRWAAKKVAIVKGLDVSKFVTSRKTKNGVIRKLLFYNAVLIMGGILDIVFMGDLIHYFFKIPIDNFVFSKLTCGILLLLEYDSIDEKVKIVTKVSVTQRIVRFVKKAKKAINVGKDFNDTHNSQ